MTLTIDPSRRPAGSGVAALFWIALPLVPLATLKLPLVSDGSARGIAATIGALTLFVAAIVATFSRRYMRADPRSGAFFGTMALLVASVLAFVLAAGLIGFALGWCASGLLLARLIGHGRDWAEAQAARRRAAAAFLIGDTALVTALALLGWWTGRIDLAGALAAVPQLSGAQATMVAALLLVAAAARCALPPFAGWLLSSMTAPTPVSALMHAGLVNAGGFLLIRFAPVLEAAPAVRIAAVAVGLIAAIYGIGVMMVRPDIKRALAGSTVSQMGFMIMSCGLGAYAAALWHLVAHGLFKAWLFLGSGSAVGMRPGPRPAPFGTALPLLIALATLGVALALVPARGGQGAGSLVPLLLATATGLATLAASLRPPLPLRERLGLVAGLGLLALLQGGGLVLAHAAAGPDGPALLPGWSLVAILAAFLGGWAWQQHRLGRGRALPPPLYVRLLNAGALTPALSGDRK